MKHPMLLRPLRADAVLRLFCLPFAGGSASSFRDWARLLPAAIEVVPLEMRGRGARFGEAPPLTMAPHIAEAAELIDSTADRPFVIFGHSMGALAAFEVAHALAAAGAALPGQLCVSAHRAPHLPSAEPTIHRLGDAGLLAHLQRMGAAPAALAEPELMRLMLPVVRADLTACETHVCADRAPLACPITAFGGKADHLVPADHLLQWRRHTLGSFRLVQFSGGHFFINDNRHTVLDALLADLRLAGLVKCSSADAQTQGYRA